MMVFALHQDPFIDFVGYFKVSVLVSVPVSVSVKSRLSLNTESSLRFFLVPCVVVGWPVVVASEVVASVVVAVVVDVVVVTFAEIIVKMYNLTI